MFKLINIFKCIFINKSQSCVYTFSEVFTNKTIFALNEISYANTFFIHKCVSFVSANAFFCVWKSSTWVLIITIFDYLAAVNLSICKSLIIFKIIIKINIE